MTAVDERLSALVSKHGLRYTRYSDDLTFSTRQDYDRGRAKSFVHAVADTLRARGMRLNASKTRFIPPGARPVVLGLLVDGPELRLRKEFRDSIRMHLHFMRTLGVQVHADRRGFDSISGLYRHVEGLIDYARSVDKTSGAETLSSFKALDWPNKWSAD